jgi:phage terminase Nu1 subunit (DNA packaging protein)
MKTLNMAQLCHALKPAVSMPTLRKIIAGNDDFPVVSRGGNGTAWRFDPAAARAWWAKHCDGLAADDTTRKRKLGRWWQQAYGGDEAAVSFDDRKKAAEIAYLEDRNRRVRGELVEARRVEAALAVAAVTLRNSLLQVPAEFAKRCAGLKRGDAAILTEIIERRLHAFEAEIKAALIVDPDTVATA